MERKKNIITINKSNNSKIQQVKMTKTARMRLLKSNPILKCTIGKINGELVNNLNLDEVIRITTEIYKKTEQSISNKIEQNQTVNLEKYRKSEQSVISKRRNRRKEISNNMPVSSAVYQPKSIPKSSTAPCVEDKLDIIPESQGLASDSVPVQNKSSSPTGVSKNNDTSTQIFKDPSNVNTRRTPNEKLSLFCSAPSVPGDLGSNLTDWLRNKYENPSLFKHLKSFGINEINVISEENKENVNVLKKNGSYEDLNIDDAISDTKHYLQIAPSDLRRKGKEALRDLLSLISEGYMMEQCEAWLRLLHKRCPQLIEESQYWECRAAIEKCRGNSGSAIKCYEPEVMQGSEVSSREKSLGKLLDNFKLLNIESTDSQRKYGNNKSILNDAKNVFTSTTIKFAVQEECLSKKPRIPGEPSPTSRNGIKVMVTPVKRTTRLNISGYTTTPGVKICCTFQEIDKDVKDHIHFQSNKALNI